MTASTPALPIAQARRVGRVPRLPAAALLMAAAAALPLAAEAQAAPVDEAMLRQRLDQQAAELQRLKADLDAVKQRQAAAPAAAAAASGEPATVLTSYGELNLNRPRKSADSQADLRRLVFGFQHRFDARTRVVTEVEVEHAVASASDSGEVAVEQAYVERQLTPDWSLRGGLFLVPLGLLNESHEPPAFYGVERNFVETAIIPTTWREGGLMLGGSLGDGVAVQFGLSTGFDLSKWDATSTEGSESPLGSIHQEMQLAHARDLSVFAAANWRGVPGLTVGGGLFTGGASQGQTTTKARVTLWEAHARWQPGAWDLSALYAHGSISHTAELNAPLVGSTTLIPAAFDGGYLQAAYKAWSREDQSLSPFLRWERYNTAKRYAELGAGLTPTAASAERVLTLGVNWQVASGVVVKADVQRFGSSRDKDRLDLGLGWAF
ncbi:MAG TPA: porin [Burkholderiaceae bacterium]|nr:porin [Burkholderiaceae bacterium]HNG78332.1 porin [Burkholderiaceae bacterium]